MNFLTVVGYIEREKVVDSSRFPVSLHRRFLSFLFRVVSIKRHGSPGPYTGGSSTCELCHLEPCLPGEEL